MIYISGAITKIGVMKATAIFNNTEFKLKEQGYGNDKTPPPTIN